VTLFAWWYSRRKTPAQPPTPLPGAEQENREPDRQALANALERLEKAYEEKDATAARSAWLDWAQLVWPEAPPHNLSRLATRCDDALSEAVGSLERTLYSPTEETGWSQYAIRQLIEQRQQQKRPDTPPEGLVPLNP
jgi:hypothetical protein